MMQDIRSVTSFVLGAVLCCLLTRGSKSEQEDFQLLRPPKGTRGGVLARTFLPNTVCSEHLFRTLSGNHPQEHQTYSQDHRNHLQDHQNHTCKEPPRGATYGSGSDGPGGGSGGPGGDSGGALFMNEALVHEHVHEHCSGQP